MGEIANVNHGPLSLISPLSAARFFEHHTFFLFDPKKTTIPTQNEAILAGPLKIGSFPLNALSLLQSFGPV